MTKFFNLCTLSLTLATASILGAAVPASAQSTDAPVSVSVQYSDLDISHSAGAKALYLRIETAAVSACGGAPDVHQLQLSASFDQCRKTAISQAVNQIDAPMLTAQAEQSAELTRVASR